jgi:putative peptide zinc metalloprotease protein
MNLTRVLNNALPDIPARTIAERYPRLDPGTTFREHIEDGERIFRVYVPCVEGMFKLPPRNWELAQLFDGKRSYAEIAELYSQKAGIFYDEEQIRDFAADLESVQFWYKTPQEKNILLMQQSADERRKVLQVKSRWADLSLVSFPAFNPDLFLTWFYSKTKFIFTWWFTLLTLVAFGITFGIFITHWSEVGRDTIEFYNFSNKTWGDVLLLYAVSMVVVAFHETGHAYACKHYGAHVRSMGFALVYLMPAFYTDTTEGVVMATRWQRFVIALAGIWAELIACSVATPVWWGTPPDTAIHDAAYYMMMQTGIMSLVLNWNPLIKLDGYHMLSETLGITDLKENSTAYVSGWVKRHIWRLPVEVPYVPKRRRIGFAVYALLSGAYSYMVLYIVARFAGNVVRNFSPEWGFVPEIGVALMIFRGRIRSLVNFMKFVYLDKREHILGWWTPKRTALAVLVTLAVLLVPFRRESVTGKFMLEPASIAIVRATVPGAITQVFVREGDLVRLKGPLAKLQNLRVESNSDEAKTQAFLAAKKAESATIHYRDVGLALKEKQELAVRSHQLELRAAELQVNSPIPGTVLTARIQDRIGSYLNEGEELLEIGDLSVLRARTYVSEYDLWKVGRHQKARLQINGVARIWRAQVASIASDPVEMDPSLQAKADLKGMNPPHYYPINLEVENTEGVLRPGMTGAARLYGDRRSLLGLGWESVSSFFGRKIW